MHRLWLALAACVLLGCAKERKPDATTRAPATPPGDTVATPSARSRDNCDYITEAEASAALDQPSMYRRSAVMGQSCTIDPASGDAFHGASVEIRVTRGDTRMYDFLAAQKSAEPLAGLGDHALWLAAGRARGNLVVVRGGDAVSLTISDLRGKGNVKARARAVATRILERL
jgi:hypothetical protein